MSSPLTPARSTAALTAVAPRSVAVASESAPCIEPIGVRAIERMTVGSSAMVAMCATPESDCCGAHKTAGSGVQTGQDPKFAKARLTAGEDRPLWCAQQGRGRLDEA